LGREIVVRYPARAREHCALAGRDRSRCARMPIAFICRVVPCVAHIRIVSCGRALWAISVNLPYSLCGQLGELYK
jgi:hypothetical protein